jgi:hypothetical protein
MIAFPQMGTTQNSYIMMRDCNGDSSKTFSNQNKTINLYYRKKNMSLSRTKQ